jgi:hypothetical protein
VKTWCIKTQGKGVLQDSNQRPVKFNPLVSDFNRRPTNSNCLPRNSNGPAHSLSSRVNDFNGLADLI